MHTLLQEQEHRPYKHAPGAVCTQTMLMWSILDLEHDCITPHYLWSGTIWSWSIDPVVSGVATGWHGWTMSRGPGAKWASERETKKKKKEEEEKRKKKKKKKRNERTNLFTYLDGGPTRCIPMSLSR